mgnify:CR=1 FL=1
MISRRGYRMLPPGAPDPSTRGKPARYPATKGGRARFAGFEAYPRGPDADNAARSRRPRPGTGISSGSVKREGRHGPRRHRRPRCQRQQFADPADFRPGPDFCDCLHHVIDMGLLFGGKAGCVSGRERADHPRQGGFGVAVFECRGRRQQVGYEIHCSIIAGLLYDSERAP